MDHSVAKVSQNSRDAITIILSNLELERSGWKFNGSSYLQYRTQFRRTIRKLIIDMTFKPSNRTGLLMFASSYPDGSGTHFMVQLNNTLEFIMTTGSSTVLLRRSVLLSLHVNYIIF